jgi:SAM-dependent methyltransferase
MKSALYKDNRMGSIDTYLSGRELIGDDFDDTQIREWFEDEKEAYSDLITGYEGEYAYGYHALNSVHGFSHIPKKIYNHVLGIGSAFGDELFPILDRVKEISILEPSDNFNNGTIKDVPCRYYKPEISGRLNFVDNSFDLVTCFGVLHHIPNVSYVLGELYRCMDSGGYLLLREPIVSMGDWSGPRPGLTRRERGFPRKTLEQIIARTGFKVRYKSYCMFSPFQLLSRKFRLPGFNSRFVTILDKIHSSLFSWNYAYHRTSSFRKIAPSNVYYVLYKE